MRIWAALIRPPHNQQDRASEKPPAKQRNQRSYANRANQYAGLRRVETGTACDLVGMV